MKSINRVVLSGNLTRDPEPFAAGATFGLAVGGREKEGDEWVDRPSFFDVTVFGRQGDLCQEYLSKGSPVVVDGRLRQDRWERDGQSRSKVVVVAENVQFGSRQHDTDQQPRAGEQAEDEVPF